MSNMQKRKEELAKKWGIKNWSDMSTKEFFAEVTKRSTAATDTEAKKDKPKTVEKTEDKKETTTVAKTEDTTAAGSSTTTNTKHEVAVSAPVINMHVPAPTVTIEANKFPGVWAIVEKVQLAFLHMVLGAAGYALLGQKLLAIAGR